MRRERLQPEGRQETCLDVYQRLGDAFRFALSNLQLSLSPSLSLSLSVFFVPFVSTVIILPSYRIILLILNLRTVNPEPDQNLTSQNRTRTVTFHTLLFLIPGISSSGSNQDFPMGSRPAFLHEGTLPYLNTLRL